MVKKTIETTDTITQNDPTAVDLVALSIYTALLAGRQSNHEIQDSLSLAQDLTKNFREAYVK